MCNYRRGVPRAMTTEGQLKKRSNPTAMRHAAQEWKANRPTGLVSTCAMFISVTGCARARRKIR